MEKLAILDCGGQYTKVIDRKIRELGVYSDILPMGTSADKLRGYGAIIFSGVSVGAGRSGIRQQFVHVKYPDSRHLLRYADDSRPLWR